MRLLKQGIKIDDISNDSYDFFVSEFVEHGETEEAVGEAVAVGKVETHYLLLIAYGFDLLAVVGARVGMVGIEA